MWPNRNAGPTVSPIATLLLSTLAAVLLFVLHRGVLTTLGICSAIALGWHVLGWW